MTFRGRPRKPSAVLELTGAFDKNPQRRAERENEPQPEGELGDVPDTLDEAEAKLWERIRTACPWLTVADCGIVEMICQLWHLSRKNKATAQERKLLAASFAQIGMTPSGRTHIKVPPKQTKSENAFSKLRKKA